VKYTFKGNSIWISLVEVNDGASGRMFLWILEYYWSYQGFKPVWSIEQTCTVPVSNRGTVPFMTITPMKWHHHKIRWAFIRLRNRYPTANISPGWWKLGSKIT